MNIAPQVFQVREAYEPRYSCPTLDVEFVPAQPSLSWAFVGQVRWGAVDTATSYRLQRKSGPSGIWTDLVSIEASGEDYETVDDVSITELAFYRVIATNSVGDSLPSHPMFTAAAPEGDVAADPPVIIPDSEVSWNITADGFTARWVPASGVINYFIDLGPDNEAFYAEFNDLDIGLVHEYTFSGLAAPASFWTFRIRANKPFAPSDSVTVLVTPGA